MDCSLLVYYFVNCRLAIKLIFMIRRRLLVNYINGELHFSSTGSWRNIISHMPCDVIIGSSQKRQKKCYFDSPTPARSRDQNTRNSAKILTMVVGFHFGA